MRDKNKNGILEVPYAPYADPDAYTEAIQEEHYYPFSMPMKGNSILTTPDAIKNRFGYNGNEALEETGFSDFNARLYRADLGRFMNVDPLATDPSQVSISPYAFAWNDPVGLSDPSGLFPNGGGDGSNTTYIATGPTIEVIGYNGGLSSIGLGSVPNTPNISGMITQIGQSSEGYVIETTDGGVFLLPPYAHRQEMKGIVEGKYYEKDINGELRKTKQATEFEVGGLGYYAEDGTIVHLRGQDGVRGDVLSMKVDLFEPFHENRDGTPSFKYINRANRLGNRNPLKNNTRINKENLAYMWHDHPDGAGYIQPPSLDDYDIVGPNSFAANVPHFVISRKNGVVYLVNSNSKKQSDGHYYSAKIDLELFYRLKESIYD